MAWLQWQVGFTLGFAEHLPRRKNGNVIQVQYTLPITFDLNSDRDYSEHDRSDVTKNDFAKKYTDSTIDKVGAGEISLSYYVFCTTQLGWINCDRLWIENSAPKVNYIVNNNAEGNSNLSIVFHRYKAIMNGVQFDSLVVFQGIPADEKITIIALKYINGKPYLAEKETQTSSRPENNLVYQPVTMELLKVEMKKLNNLN